VTETGNRAARDPNPARDHDDRYKEDTMSRLIEFPLDSTGQTTILVESNDPTPEQGQTRVSLGGAMAEQASQGLDEALATVKPIAAAAIRHLSEAVADASEIGIEFGIKLTAKAGVILAGVAAEGNFTVSIKWSRKP
jgi:hypothetical protein